MTPRLVVIEPTGKFKNGYSPNGDVRHKRRTTYRKKVLPVQFSVNSKAREFALRHYILRFTISVAVNTGGLRVHRDFLPFTFCHANVVMSPEDTLGLLGWCKAHPESGWKFHVENVAWESPWVGNKPTACGTQPDVKKVAFLQAYLGPRSRILHALNSTVSWDVTSILHTKSAMLSRLYPLGPPWYTHKFYAMDFISIRSRTFSGTLKEWGERLSYRLRHRGLQHCDADILAFELGRRPEEGFRPAETMANLLDGPDGDYFSREREWLQSHPCPQGF